MYTTLPWQPSTSSAGDITDDQTRTAMPCPHQVFVQLVDLLVQLLG
jgi:hypothetical protein